MHHTCRASEPVDPNGKTAMPHPKPGTAAAHFRAYERDWPGNYWDIAKEIGGNEVLKLALLPNWKEEAYLAVLNGNNHVSVIHPSADWSQS